MNMRRVSIFVLSLAFAAPVNARVCEYDVVKVNYKNLAAKLFLPKAAGIVPVVIAIGGSEGGLDTGSANGELMAPQWRSSIISCVL